MATTVAELLANGRRRLANAAFQPPPREAALLLGKILGWNEAKILAHGERRVPEEARERFLGLLARRLKGEPFAYLTGEREFYGRLFRVDPRVLIPRPETEHLVEEVLNLGLPDSPRFLDIGTGSGCLAVTLALELGGSCVAVDISPGALAVAAANTRRHAVEDRVALAAADLGIGLDLSSFDLAVSNPPYIDRNEAPDLSPEVTAFEPDGALFAADSGDGVLRRLFRKLSGLRSGISLLVEIGHLHGPRMAALLQETPFELVGIVPDYAGIPRVARLVRR